MKLKATFILLLFTAIIYSQGQEIQEEYEDFEYELTHKSQPWFSEMKDGADYFDVKKNYDFYFGNRRTEKSKPRSIGESWLKSKLFYLDENGKVQSEPQIHKVKRYNTSLNTFNLNTTTKSGTWDLIGPVNSAETRMSVSGNHGGFVFMTRIDPTNTSKFYASFAGGGLWATIDSGKSWTLTDSEFPDDFYYDLDVVVSNPNFVYAISRQQVIKSTDGGLNWLPTALTTSKFPGRPYDIAASTTNPNIVLARWGDKLYRTINGGGIWTAVLSGLPLHNQIGDCSIQGEMLDWSSTDPNVAYCLSTSQNNQMQVYRSGNAGLTFTQIATLTLPAEAVSQSVAWGKLMLPTTNTKSIYVAIGNVSAHLYKLNAKTGAIENIKANMIPGVGDPYKGDPIIAHGDICMDRNDENKLAYGTYGGTRVFYSSDNGDTFVRSSSGIHYDLRSISVVDGKILAGTDAEGALSTDFGLSFKTATNSISNHELWGFGSAFKTSTVVSGNNHGPFMVKETASDGFDWYNGRGADQGNTDLNPLDENYIFTQGPKRYIRTGPRGIRSESCLLDLGGIYNYFNSLEFAPNNYYSLITHHAGRYPSGNPNVEVWKNSLIKTEDSGNTISVIKTFTNQVFREKISMKNPNHIYVVEGLSKNKLWHTADGGLTWTDVTPNTTVTSGQKNISDIAVGDENPNEIWVTYSGVQTVCKVLKSSDFGASWTNLTQPILTSTPITKLIFQRGSNGGVYVGSRAGVFYKNNSMPSWALIGDGLPMCDVRFMFINYNENKLKIGTSRGAFAHNLFEVSPPNAMISASTSNLTCPTTEKVQFKDYSVVRNASATWQWSFPGGTPAKSTAENPLVSYEDAPDGMYDVSLTVTDFYGTSTQTLSNFIKVNNICGTTKVETKPGNVAKIAGTGDYMQVNKLKNLNRNSFTFSCWIKPNGIQENFSGIFSSQGSNTSFIMNFLGGNNSIGFHPNLQWNSGLKTPAGQWSHVALVSNGTQVKIYVNGIESINNYALSSQLITTLNFGRFGLGRADRYTNLEMDEVCVWDRPLSRDEIRQWRHLTKSDLNDPIRNGLVLYYQFNEVTGNISLNKAESSNHVSYMGQTGLNHNTSSATVFGGVSQKIAVTTAGAKDFNTTGLSMKFANGTTPNGDVWVSRSTINPDELPDASSNFGSYTIVNNYGTSPTFTPLESMTFTGNAKYTTRTADKYKLYKRGSNDFGKTWGNAIDTGDSLTGTAGIGTAITFSTGLSVSSFSQFVLSIGDSNKLSVDDFRINNEPLLYPNPIEANENLNIKIPSDWEIATLIIYNIQGQRIGQATLNPGENNLRINASTGIYNLVIFNSVNKISKKLIVK